MIIGWTLINSCVENDVYRFSYNKIEELQRHGRISSNLRIALALQICVDSEYRNSGVLSSMFKYFENLLFGKYDYIEASVRNTNDVAKIAIQKLGFSLIEANEERGFFLKKIVSNNISILTTQYKVKEKSYSVRLANENDVTKLWNLNKKMVNNMYNISNNSNHLTSLYNESDFKKIILKSEIVIADLLD